MPAMPPKIGRGDGYPGTLTRFPATAITSWDLMVRKQVCLLESARTVRKGHEIIATMAVNTKKDDLLEPAGMPLTVVR